MGGPAPGARDGGVLDEPEREEEEGAEGGGEENDPPVVDGAGAAIVTGPGRVAPTW